MYFELSMLPVQSPWMLKAHIKLIAGYLLAWSWCRWDCVLYKSSVFLPNQIVCVCVLLVIHSFFPVESKSLWQFVTSLGSTPPGIKWHRQTFFVLLHYFRFFPADFNEATSSSRSSLLLTIYLAVTVLCKIILKSFLFSSRVLLSAMKVTR